MNCGRATQIMPLFLYGELSFDDEDQFEAHLDECQTCRAELSRQKIFLRSFDAVQAGVSPELLRQSRQELRSRIAEHRPPQDSIWNHLRDFFPVRFHIPAMAQPFGALVLIAMGFFGARFVPQITSGGITSAGLAEPVASRVRYLEPESPGRVQIVVEETRQRTLSGRLDDEPIQRLLIAAAKDPVDPGLRVESMDLLKAHPEDAEVRTALLFALQHDANPGVRLKALDGLKGSAEDPEIRQTLTRVLLTDKNPGVRTQVIDLLIQQKQQPHMAGVLQELMRKEDNGYVRMRCQKALHDMKASVDTF